jgi:hypothetical protein
MQQSLVASCSVYMRIKRSRRKQCKGWLSASRAIQSDFYVGPGSPLATPYILRIIAVTKSAGQALGRTQYYRLVMGGTGDRQEENVDFRVGTWSGYSQNSNRLK